MTNNTLIKVSNVSKTFILPHEKNNSIKNAVINFYKRKRSYEKQKVLNEVSFEIKKGDFFGIVGRNGSGKSTLLKLLAGIYTPSKGSIEVNGKLTPFIELGVGFNPELSGRENVFLNGALLGFSRNEMSKMYDEIVEFAELERFMDQKLKNYSSGMQVRLAFSIAIRAKGDILLLDEVLAVGDAAFQQKCYNYFEELKRNKKTVVFVSHDMSAVRRFCSHAIYIKDGFLVEEASASDIADKYIEENLKADDLNSSEKISNKHSLTGELIKRANGTISLKTFFNSEDDDEVYIGISIIKDGMSIAEIVTPPEKHLKNKGRATYTLDLNILNAGIYRIDTALFKTKNRQLVATGKDKFHFTVKGYDPNKGGPLKLDDTWSYE